MGQSRSEELTAISLTTVAVSRRQRPGLAGRQYDPDVRTGRTTESSRHAFRHGSHRAVLSCKFSDRGSLGISIYSGRSFRATPVWRAASATAFATKGAMF